MLIEDSERLPMTIDDESEDDDSQSFSFSSFVSDDVLVHASVSLGVPL